MALFKKKAAFESRKFETETTKGEVKGRMGVKSAMDPKELAKGLGDFEAIGKGEKKGFIMALTKEMDKDGTSRVQGVMKGHDMGLEEVIRCCLLSLNMTAKEFAKRQMLRDILGDE